MGKSRHAYTVQRHRDRDPPEAEEAEGNASSKL